MKPVAIEDPAFESIVSGAGLRLTQHDDGAVQVEIRGPCLGVTAPTSPAAKRDWFYKWHGSATGTFYIVGRESIPPLQGLKRIPRKYAVLGKHQAAHVNSTKDVEAVIAILIEQGWNVNHDVYVFSSMGGWLLYVSHHDEIQAWIAIADESAKIAPR